MRNVVLRAMAGIPALLLSTVLAAAAPAAEWPEADAFAEGTARIFASDGSRDVETGIAQISRAAEAGNAEAQYALALLYRQGGLIRKDAAKSRALLESAAEKGIPEAQAVLGVDILKSLRYSDSPKTGRALLEKAAAKGVLRAHSDLGQNYLEKIPLSYEKALKHLTIAAEAGLVDAQLRLGTAYYHGWSSQAPPQYKEAL